MDRKEAAKILGIAATAGIAAAGAYMYVQYRKAQLDLEADRLAEVLALKPGARVADVGAGVGNVAVRIADRVGASGRVYAVEVEHSKLRKLQARKEKEQLTNIDIVTGTSSGCNLPENSCDAIFLRGAYHHLTAPSDMNASLLRALRPGGTLAVIDFAPRLLLKPWTPKGIPDDRGGHGIRHTLVELELVASGFELVRVIPDWPGGKYCVLVQKPINL